MAFHPHEPRYPDLFRYNLRPRGDSGEGKAFEPLKILYRTVKRLALDPFSGKLELLPAILLVALVFGAALLLMSKKGRKKLRTVFLLFTAADFLYLCAVNVMSDGTGRYSGPAVAVWMLLLYGAAVYVFLELLTAGKGRLRLLSILPAAFLGLVLCINIAKSTSPGGIDGLCADSAEPLLKEQYAEIPWVVFCHEHTWYEEGVAYKYMIPEKLCFVSPDHPAEAGIALPEEFVLVCADADLTEALDYLEELDGSSPEQTDEIAWGTMAARRMRIH